MIAHDRGDPQGFEMADMSSPLSRVFEGLHLMCKTLALNLLIVIKI